MTFALKLNNTKCQELLALSTVRGNNATMKHWKTVQMHRTKTIR